MFYTHNGVAQTNVVNQALDKAHVPLCFAGERKKSLCNT